MSKIVYLIEQPLDARNYDRFGIQSWIGRGWDVEVWDLTPLSYPRVWRHFLDSGHALKEFAGYCPIASGSELSRKCSAPAKIAYFVDITGNHYHSVRAKTRLARIGAVRVIFDVGSMPQLGDGRPSGLVAKIRKAVRRSPVKSLKLLANAVAARLVASLVRPGLIVVSGEKSKSEATRMWRDVHLVRAHNLDYDLYLRLTQTDVRSRTRYAVFLDQDVCGHSDFIYQDVPFVATPEKYYPAVCRGLRKISEELGFDLRVAAHPRSSYQHPGWDPFDGIPIEYGNTAEMIRGSEIVVGHYTTAIQLAVLFEKPVVFFTTDELEASSAGRLIALFASELGKRVISVDRDLGRVDWRGELYVDAQKYAAYRTRYIKTEGSPEKLSWDIVIDCIESAGRQASATPQHRRRPRQS